MKLIRLAGYLLMGYLIYQIYQLLSANADRIAGAMGGGGAGGGGGEGSRGGQPGDQPFGAHGQNITGPGEGMPVNVDMGGGERTERVGRGVVRR